MSRAESIWQVWKTAVRKLKENLYALYLACRDPRVPRYAKLVAVCVVAYAFSPVDLIPDFIPVLGYLDDLILVPLGISIALKLIPPRLLDELRRQAAAISTKKKPVSRVAGGLIILVWIVVGAWFAWRLFSALRYKF